MDACRSRLQHSVNSGRPLRCWTRCSGAHLSVLMKLVELWPSTGSNSTTARPIGRVHWPPIAHACSEFRQCSPFVRCAAVATNCRCPNAPIGHSSLGATSWTKTVGSSAFEWTISGVASWTKTPGSMGCPSWITSDVATMATATVVVVESIAIDFDSVDNAHCHRSESSDVGHCSHL